MRGQNEGEALTRRRQDPEDDVHLPHLGAAEDEREGAQPATYDETGNLETLFVQRSGTATCLAGTTCSQAFRYQWDELGRPRRARRWDTAAGFPNVPAFDSGGHAADLRYVYAAGDQRVIKTATDGGGNEVHTLYIYPSLELRRAEYDTAGTPGDYVRDNSTEAAYLFANGVRLARLVHEPLDSAGDGQLLWVFFELGDHLGSTSVALDKGTSELVQRSTYQAYGGAESDYRPGKWGEFREDYRFTGKEEDVEVGLFYFGKRFYNPLLQRWVSADPLEVHVPGEADANLYAYVSGMVLTAVDLLGLDATQSALRFEQRQTALRQRIRTLLNKRLRGYVVPAVLEGFRQEVNRELGLPTRLFIRPLPGERALWKTQFKHYLPKRFLDRYMANQGGIYKLSRQEALDTYAQINVAENPRKKANPAFQAHVQSVKELAAKSDSGIASKQVEFSGLATAANSGTLGNFTVYYKGELTYNNNTSSWHFKGKMEFYDEWDFNKDGAAMRSPSGQRKVEAAHEHLAGAPFAIVGPSFDVEQSSRDTGAKWAGSGRHGESVQGPTQAGQQIQEDVRH